jgi:hypothetical protein
MAVAFDALDNPTLRLVARVLWYAVLAALVVTYWGSTPWDLSYADL